MIKSHSESIGRLLATYQSPIGRFWLIKLAGIKFQQSATPKCQFKTSRNRHAAMLLVISKFYHTELQFYNINYSCAFPTIDYCTIVSAALPCSLRGGSCSMSGNSAQSPLVTSSLLGVKWITDTNLIDLCLVVVFCGEASAAYRRIGRLEETWPIFSNCTATNRFHLRERFMIANFKNSTMYMTTWNCSVIDGSEKIRQV